MFGIRTTAIYRPAELLRSALYRRFIKRFPCIGCGRRQGSDPCHAGPHGISQKASDVTCIPLCRRCHDLFDSNPRQFVEARGIDIAALQRLFRSLYRIKYPERPLGPLHVCKCGLEDLADEFPAVCPECGRTKEERKAA